jgi:hypothetical protein
VRFDIRQVIGERNTLSLRGVSMRGQKEGGDIEIFLLYGQNLRLKEIISPLIVHYNRKNNFGKKKHCRN